MLFGAKRDKRPDIRHLSLRLGEFWQGCEAGAGKQAGRMCEPVLLSGVGTAKIL